MKIDFIIDLQMKFDYEKMFMASCISIYFNS